MSLPSVTITIDANDFDAALTVADADIYESASFGAEGTAWRAASDDDKPRALVTAFRDLSQLSFTDGAETDSDFLVAWPSANAEYAASLIEGSFFEQRDQVTQGLKMIKAGRVTAEYFLTALLKTGQSVTLPSAVFALLKTWLAGQNSTLTLGVATGTDGCSQFQQDYRQVY